MSAVTIAFLGDIFGSPGRQVVQQQLPALLAEHRPQVVANAENARSGSGLTPELYRKIRGYGIDAITLGDHVFRDRSIVEILESPAEPIARPANLAEGAPGRSVTRISLPPLVRGSSASSAEGAEILLITVLGRIFMNLPANDPFAAVDRALEQAPGHKPIVIVEAHMEATSEKAALAHYLDGRAALVVGTHTHVPTADERILPGGTGFISDVGMCGPHASIIGRDPAAVLRHMTTGVHVPYEVGHGGEALCGVVAVIDRHTRRCQSIQRVRYEADLRQPPFV
jgi:metallophosphoesterase (TIGR00282 family)